ncbi:AAA family ATPase [Anaeromyxobacter sp. Fw109-5]|uniref:AAA family ATPase n=1 Tax=Anaeromyxobacter sp. (strain Fw109-5) TaxID=404589 RepID=UPI0002EA27E4|nr:AAA family ATPase [Anaeromyxobacter sp. Fw109-5]
MSAPDLVVLAGLQGAGKSSFYRARFAATHAHVSKDLFRSARDKGRRQRELVTAAARAGGPAVIDDTNPRRADRAVLVALARELGMRPLLYWFPPDVRASLARNAERTGRAQVPKVAIFATAQRLEPPEPAEGFASVYEVQAAPEGAFLVTARPELGAP